MAATLQQPPNPTNTQRANMALTPATSPTPQPKSVSGRRIRPAQTTSVAGLMSAPVPGSTVPTAEGPKVSQQKEVVFR